MSDSTSGGLPEPTEDDFSDGWITFAVARFPDGASLQDIISAADMFNHSIPNRLEVEHALCRLGPGGWLRRDAERYVMTDLFPDRLRLWPAAGILGASSTGRILPPYTDASDWRISEAEWNEALTAYKEEMEVILAQMAEERRRTRALGHAWAREQASREHSQEEIRRRWMDELEANSDPDSGSL